MERDDGYWMFPLSKVKDRYGVPTYAVSAAVRSGSLKAYMPKASMRGARTCDKWVQEWLEDSAKEVPAC